MLRNTVRSTSATIKNTRFTPITMVRFNTEGATGAGYARPGGQAAGDSFTKREKAAEDMYIKQQEAMKLKQLQEKVRATRKHLDELDKHIEEEHNNQGGEKN
ncbi:mitochondrial ATPase inhibitor, IATP-domain-containing protein [Pyronema domesticum]|uniref:ATPase inhibitor, mitochondrial n=1 Tax=Pyronema omphalodes (strain CBS 100304) TaxID=1076935 RepID=U4KUH7_PYROM|nr:mitochondrial ATPase inhibitor, IATP-domain-containing protein [Pyronema domesticum]CCX04697.1 Similar to ATPase inhibitor, mitochondrial; acc. no. P01097 [Pyronema omphalodes CBS 100304]